MRIDQFLPGFAPHDAIGNHVLQVRRRLRDQGIDSDIWAEVIHPPLEREARPYRECPDWQAGDQAVALYHLSTDSDMAPWLIERARCGQRLLVHYHNITPSAYFAPWEPAAAASMDRARRQLGELAEAVHAALAVSSFNQAELVEAGFRRPATAPLLLDLSDYRAAPNARMLERLRRGGGSRWLFVGRLAPNKCQHDVIAAFAVYRRLVDPAARLTLVGSSSSARYLRSLQQMGRDLDIGGSVDIPGGVPFADLLAHFAAADIFVCLSEHEGFGVPLIEAMELGVPVVAYRAAAVPETVADGGVLIDDKDPVTVAATVEAVLTDEAMRAALVRAGRARAAEFALAVTAPRFLDRLLDAAGDGRQP